MLIDIGKTVRIGWQLDNRACQRRMWIILQLDGWEVTSAVKKLEMFNQIIPRVSVD